MKRFKALRSMMAVALAAVLVPVLIPNKVDAADAAATGNGSAALTVTVSMSATVVGSMNLTYDCPGGDGVTATDGGSASTMSLAFGNVNAFPDTDLAGNLRALSVSSGGASDGGYYFTNCTLTTRISGVSGTPTVRANTASVVNGMDPRLVMDTSFVAGFSGSGTYDVPGTVATVSAAGFDETPATGRLVQNLWAGIYVSPSATTGAQSADLILTLAPL